MKARITAVLATALTLVACGLTPAIQCDDSRWDPTALTCESVAQAASAQLLAIPDVTHVEIIGPEGCPEGGRGCAFNSGVAIVAVATESGRDLSLLVTVENGRVVSGPIEESSPVR